MLLVDTNAEPLAEEFKGVVDSLTGGQTPKYIINTHKHVEHVGGNAIFGPEPIKIAHDLMPVGLRSGGYLFDEFPEEICVEPGVELEMKDQDGDTLFARIVSVGKSRAKLDINHPLAGKQLTFDVTIVALRQPTPEELEHGHVHGSEGHVH